MKERATKICAVCGRPFEWRRKWRNVWEEVRYCSERCRRRRAGGSGDGGAAVASSRDSEPR